MPYADLVTPCSHAVFDITAKHLVWPVTKPTPLSTSCTLSLCRLAAKAIQAELQQVVQALVSPLEDLEHNPHNLLALLHLALGQPAHQPLARPLCLPLALPPPLPSAQQALAVGHQPLEAQHLPLAKAVRQHLAKPQPLAHLLLPLVVVALGHHRAQQLLVPRHPIHLAVSRLLPPLEQQAAALLALAHLRALLALAPLKAHLVLATLASGALVRAVGLLPLELLPPLPLGSNRARLPSLSTLEVALVPLSSPQPSGHLHQQQALAPQLHLTLAEGCSTTTSSSNSSSRSLVGSGSTLLVSQALRGALVLLARPLLGRARQQEAYLEPHNQALPLEVYFPSQPKEALVQQALASQRSSSNRRNSRHSHSNSWPLQVPLTLPVHSVKYTFTLCSAALITL